MFTKPACLLSAFVLGLSGVAAHADTTFTFTLDSGNYPPITATIPDVFNYSLNPPYISSPPVTEEVGNATMHTYVIFTPTQIDFAGRDADVDTTQPFFNGSSFINGSYSALLYNDYPERYTGIPEGTGLLGTLVLSSPTPEPSSLLLMGTGVLGAAGVVRRRFSLR